MNFRRLKQVCQYGWKDAAIISNEEGVNQSRWSIFFDMLYCYLKYNVWTNQYKMEKLYSLDKESRKVICMKYQEENTKRDLWVKAFFDNYKFLNKWSNFKYERSASLQSKRCAAYKMQYGLGEKCFIGYHVIFHKHHYVEAKIQTGKNCYIAEETNIDYTGGLILGDKVSISEGVKILTHNHSTSLKEKGLDKGCVLTSLIIHDRAWIGTRAVIMPGVKEIGRGAIISADSYVHTKVPPYAIVLGNPAKVVGFRMPLEDILEYERANYEEKDRIPTEVLNSNYEKYFRNRWKEIKQWCRM